MRRGLSYVFCASLSLGLLSWFLLRHLHDLDLSRTNFAIAYTMMFGYLALNMVASFAAKPHERDPRFDYSSLTTDVVLPVYNEHPELLAAGLRSIADQTWRPTTVWIIDDGSDELVLDTEPVAQAMKLLVDVGVTLHTHRQVNRGKRHAQVYAFARSDADIFVTLDSDTVLAEDALEQLLYAFSRPETQAVGGLAAGQNHKHNLLTRVVELGFVMAFLSGRLAEGYFGAVRVNCGIIAAYRGDSVRDNLHRYLGQTWLGETVKIGDDRALTVFARERGRTEFQATAVAYSALPITLSHLLRQRVRWARSWYWGTLWLLRRPLNTADFWFTATQLLGMISYLLAIMFAIVGTAVGIIHPRLLVATMVTSIFIGSISTLRYVFAGRPDESWASRLLTWSLSPLSSVLYMFLLVPLYWYAGLVPRTSTWGTREVVEVELNTRQSERVGGAV